MTKSVFTIRKSELIKVSYTVYHFYILFKLIKMNMNIYVCLFSFLILFSVLLHNLHSHCLVLFEQSIHILLQCLLVCPELRVAEDAHNAHTCQEILESH